MIYIHEMSIFDTICIDGYPILGLRGLKQRVEKSTYRWSLRDAPIRKCEHELSPVHVGEVWESYPKFDSFDDADNRTFQNYIVRTSPICDEEMLRFAKMETFCNDCRIHESMPEDMLPMVYYKGEGNVMLLATTSPVQVKKDGSVMVSNGSSLFARLCAKITSFFMMAVILLTVISCRPNTRNTFQDDQVNRIAAYVTCPADTIRIMLAAADSICRLADGASLENLGLDDDIYNIPLKIRFHKEIPVLVQIYATYDVVTNFPSAYANAPFAWHEVALQQMADYYEKEQVTQEDIEALFGAMNAILDDYDCGTQYDLNISAARSVMLADFRLLSAYKSLFDQCQTPSLLESVHGSYEYLLEIYSDRYNNVTSQGHWSDQPRELASMLVCMMNEKREWVEALQSRLEKGELTVKDIKSELDARPADTDDWEYLDY